MTDRESGHAELVKNVKKYMSKMEKKNDNNIECEKLLKRELYKLWYFLIILSLFGFPCTLHTFGI